MTGTDPMTRSGARWCEEHERWECAAKRDKPHHATAMRGMAYCKHHVGKTTALARAQGEANLMAWSSEAAGASAVPLEPGRVVMDQLRVAVLRADLYGELLRLQVASAAESDDFDVDGLVAPTFSVGREGQRVQSGEQVRGLAKLEAEWRDRAVRFAKTAHDMGIDERQIQLEEAQAVQVVGAAKAMLEVLDLGPDEHERAIRAFLGALGRGEAVAGEVTE